MATVVRAVDEREDRRRGPVSRRRGGHPPAYAFLLLAPLVFVTGCFGLFHSMNHHHRAARAIFWTEVSAFGLAYATNKDDPGTLTDADVVLIVTVAACEIYDVFGAALKGHSKDCRTCAKHAVVTPTGAWLLYRF